MTIMKHLISKKYVPCRLTSCYKLINQFKDKTLTPDTTWSELEKDGRKPFLSNQGLQKLIDDIKDSSDGGLAISLSEIRRKIITRSKIDGKMKLNIEFNF